LLSNCYAQVQTGVLHATLVLRQIGASGASTVESGSSMQVNVGASHSTAVHVISQPAGRIVVMPGVPAVPSSPCGPTLPTGPIAPAMPSAPRAPTAPAGPVRQLNLYEYKKAEVEWRYQVSQAIDNSTLRAGWSN
jgi:hypothetical protein